MIGKKGDGIPDSSPVLELNPDLAALGSMAASVDADTAFQEVPPGEQAIEQGTNYAIEARQMVDLVGALVVGFCGEAAPLWVEQTKQGMAGSLVPVLEKYNFTMAGMPVEIAAIVVCGPVLWQSARLIGDKVKRDRAAAERAAQEAAPHHRPRAQAASGDTPATGTEAPAATMPQMALYPNAGGMPIFPDM